MSTERLPARSPVVVAGGGPVGLATAVELALHGVRSVVIERRGEVSWLRPRAKTTSARSMEHFRRWGLAETLRSRAPLPVEWSDEAVFCTNLLGAEITRIDRCFGLDLAGSELVAECGQQVPQPLVEQVLRDAVVGSPNIRLFTGLEVVAVRGDSHHVDVDVVNLAGERQQITADYVVGCEGARSVVREAIGAEYEGSADARPNFNIVFRAPTLAAEVPHGPAVHYWVLDHKQPGLVGRLDLADTWWCIAQGVTAESGAGDPEQIVRNLVGAPIPLTVLATDAWRARMLLADRYADGRMFLAGDSAHQNPPWGGHGFNTGIGDAVNLGWKLAAVLNGWAPVELLDSYEFERRPVAAQTIAEAAANMATLSPELAGHAASPAAAAAAIKAGKDNEFHSLSLTLGYAYPDSPIIAGESHPPSDVTESASGDYQPSAAPGHRLPHRWLAPGLSLYDQLGAEFTLVGDLTLPVAGQLISAARSADTPLELVALSAEDSQELLSAGLALVRPDQHVAWRGNGPADADAILRKAVGHAIG